MSFVPSPEQQAVIDAPLQSLRISAGAGTGKTATLAHRIARLVESGAIQPERMLGITFTTKATEELSERIRLVTERLADPARAVEVATYHGFAHSLLVEFGALVGVERNTQIVTPTFARQMLADLVASIPMAAYDATRPSVVEDVRSIASALSDHLLDPREVDLPDEPEPWPARRDLIRLVRAYDEEKRRLGVADYGDLVRLAHRLVTRHPAVAATIRSRYDLVALDEYQDTNPAQRELLRALFDEEVPVMAVGDPDQTIYEWRGASLQNFRRFPEHFGSGSTPTATLHLTRNRRSGPRLLELANRVRERIDHRPRVPLTALDDAPPGSISATWHGTASAEADAIAERIRALHEQRGRSWSEMAILFRKNKDMRLVHDALARHDVPFEVANLGGLLSVPEVADLHAWLKILENPEQAPALARLLMGSRFRLGMADLGPLATWIRTHRPETDLDLDHERMPEAGHLEAIDHLDAIEGLRPEARAALSQFAVEYRTLLQTAQGSSLVELCRTILDTTRAWTDIDSMDRAAGLSARLNLYRFLDLAESWSPLEGRPSLRAFLDHLGAMEEDPAEELDTARISDSDAVTLITVHRAKGLEWPIVFLPALVHGNFPSRSHGFDNPLRSPTSIPFEWRLDREDLPELDPAMSQKEQNDLLRVRHDSQEWRIAYVAITRAQEELHLSGAFWYGNPEPTKRPAQPSELFLLGADHASEPVVPPDEAPPRPESVGYRSAASPAPDPHFPDGWTEILRRTIDDADHPRALATSLGIAQAYDAAVDDLQQRLFDLPEPIQDRPEPTVDASATGLVTYAVCPKRYFWSDVDPLPRRPSAAARRGSEIHRRIELHHLGAVPLEDAIPAHVPEPGDEPPSGTDPFGAFRASRFADHRPRLVEAPFALRVDDDVWVRGRIDAVYDHGQGAFEVVDFKSGRHRTDDDLLVQLQVYALALVDVPLVADPIERLSVTFAYLGGGPVEETHEVDDAWLERARTRVRRIGEAISEHRWDPTPGPHCRGCDFLRVCDAGRRFVDGT